MRVAARAGRSARRGDLVQSCRVGSTEGDIAASPAAPRSHRPAALRSSRTRTLASASSRLRVSSSRTSRARAPGGEVVCESVNPARRNAAAKVDDVGLASAVSCVPTALRSVPGDRECAGGRTIRPACGRGRLEDHGAESSRRRKEMIDTSPPNVSDVEAERASTGGRSSRSATRSRWVPGAVGFGSGEGSRTSARSARSAARRTSRSRRPTADGRPVLRGGDGGGGRTTERRGFVRTTTRRTTRLLHDATATRRAVCHRRLRINGSFEQLSKPRQNSTNDPCGHTIRGLSATRQTAHVTMRSQPTPVVVRPSGASRVVVDVPNEHVPNSVSPPLALLRVHALAP